MKLKNVLIVTNDIERSRKFYHDLFGLASWLLWQMSGSAVLLIGGVICFAAGMLKVLWKFIVVLQKKNVWPLFVQMRIGMPVGFWINNFQFVRIFITTYPLVWNLGFE